MFPVSFSLPLPPQLKVKVKELITKLRRRKISKYCSESMEKSASHDEKNESCRDYLLASCSEPLKTPNLNQNTWSFQNLWLKEKEKRNRKSLVKVCSLFLLKIR